MTFRPSPDEVESIADGMDFTRRGQRSAQLRECADAWRLDQAVIDAVLNSDPFRLHVPLLSRSWVECVFCGATGRTPETTTHEGFCARLLAEFRRPDL